ncbi:Ubiquinone biosynthesis protein [Dimargaris verticillata]|uniref:4-hydroxy-3-methoxy-5-polyprenylbenzoate decarboxylase n=1 Tax=Dimargaris verticillata TaxID=2761393 RepID=A0A9W8ECF4_9FUNG|nr:Ubiquinone biosynthesis protein [Dimargaris verticillata]
MASPAQPISCLQRAILTVGSAFAAAYNPTRADMVAVLGEVTGDRAVKAMHRRMLLSTSGREILRTRPRLTSQTMNLPRLRSLPDCTFGREYARFMDSHGFTPESRNQVQYIPDPELAYVLQRYRETHDFIHVLTGITQVTVASETAVKWFEWMQTGLPMTLASSVVGPFISDASDRKFLFTSLVPWAVQSGSRAQFFLNVPYEAHWETPLEELQRLMRIIPAPQMVP